MRRNTSVQAYLRLFNSASAFANIDANFVFIKQGMNTRKALTVLDRHRIYPNVWDCAFPCRKTQIP